jgi:hypothetical protein
VTIFLKDTGALLQLCAKPFDVYVSMHPSIKIFNLILVHGAQASSTQGSALEADGV